jgi:beta-lactam-binding protein with PASTA domain
MVQVPEPLSSSPPAPAPTGAIYANLNISGDVNGQLAVGDHIIQVHGGHFLGNVVNVLPSGTVPTVTARPVPTSLLPRRPVPMFDRATETALSTAEIAAGRPVEVSGAAGLGKSTLLRHLAHQAELAQSCGGVAHLSARGLSRDDLLQALFEVFYACDVPVKPSAVELRNRLQNVRAALLLDDVDLTGEELQELEDFAPRCGFVLACERAHRATGARSLLLSGLPADDARQLFAHALGRTLLPEELPSADVVCGLARGEPERLLQLGATAAGHAGTLTQFAASVLQASTSVVPADSPQDMRLLELLAAVPGLQLDADQLAAISGLRDAGARMERLVSRGLVLASAPAAAAGVRAPITYGLASSVVAVATSWDLDPRREDVHAYFTRWAGERAGAVLPPGPQVEALRIVQADAVRHGRWRSVLALGVLLDSAFALSGRWDAWEQVARASLHAARATGDRRAEALALHQLGTRALCVGDVPTAKQVLTSALHLRRDLGDTRAAQVTAHNLALLVAPPVPPPSQRPESGGPPSHGAGGRRLAGLLRRAPWGVKVLAVVVPLTAVLAFVLTTTGRAAAGVDPSTLQFTAQTLNLASQARDIVLANHGRDSMQVQGLTLGGPEPAEFTVTGSTCLRREIPGGESCRTTVVFTPVGTGAREATLTWRVPGADHPPVSFLRGVGVAAPRQHPSVSPRSLGFPTQPVNTSSAPERLLVIAPAATGLTLGQVSMGGLHGADYLIVHDGCSQQSLPPAGRCIERIRFTPGGEGERSALLAINGSDGRTAVAVPLAGAGSVPPPDAPLRVEPSSLDFADTAVARTSSPDEVRLSNRGTSARDVGTVSILGAADFTLARSDCPATLRPGDECRLGVVFTPAAPGQRTAQLVVQAPGTPTIPLRGTGVAPPPGAPQLTPRAVRFPGQPVETVSPPRTVTVTNRAPAPVRIRGAAATGATGGFRIDASDCTRAAVAAGGTCRVGVWFTPRQAGDYTGVLSLDVAGEAQPSSVVLTGRATAPGMVSVPDLIARPLPSARNALERLNLTVGQITTATHPDIPAGAVVDQAPRPPAQVRPGSSVDLVVSSGQPMVIVPPLVGLPQSVAERQLDTAGLTVGDVTTRSDPHAAKGTVLDTRPAAGSEVVRGTSVSLVISLDQVPVPDVTHKQEADAERALRDADLAVGPVQRKNDENAPTGTVLSTDPPAGTMADRKSSVALTVSDGPVLVAVPDVTNLPRNEAEQVLRDHRLVPGEVLWINDPHVARGSVVVTRPAATTMVPVGRSVDLTLSMGARQVQVRVPRVAGLSEQAARALLQRSRLGVSVARQASARSAGTVAEQHPGAGELADPGHVVQIVVSTGPGGSDSSGPSSPSGPPSPSGPSGPSGSSDPPSSSNSSQTSPSDEAPASSSSTEQRLA